MKTRKKEKLPSYFQEVLQKILFTYDTLFKPYPWQWIWPFSLYSVDKRFWIPPPPNFLVLTAVCFILKSYHWIIQVLFRLT